MKRNYAWLVAALAVAALLPFVPVEVAAQVDLVKGGKAPAKGGAKAKDDLTPEGPTPRLPDGKVDFNGVYSPANFANYGTPMPLQPWAKKVYDDRRATLSKDDPEGNCLPAGVPRISPFPQKFVQTKDLLVILDEGNVHSYRQIFIDGRGHPEGIDHLWMGHSIAKWDGDTLVVDSVGFNDKTWLNGQGLPHTDQLHVTEKYTRPDLGHVNVEITVEDPGALTAPHTFTRTFLARPTWELLEYVCNEFNIDADRLVGQ